MMSSTKMMMRIKNTNKARVICPPKFKLSLISEVRKHSIIWQNLKDKKNKDLLEYAWKEVRKALAVKEAGFCEKQWKLLIQSYRSHVNNKLPMRVNLVKAMAFMEPQLKKSPTNINKQNDVDSRPKEQEKTLPKPAQDQVRRGSASEDGPASVRSVSLFIVNHLFDSLPADAMTHVYESLLQVLLKLRPNLVREIVEVGRRQTDLQVFNPDWSELALPAELCQEIWKRELQKRIRSSFNAETK